MKTFVPIFILLIAIAFGLFFLFGGFRHSAKMPEEFIGKTVGELQNGQAGVLSISFLTLSSSHEVWISHEDGPVVKSFSAGDCLIKKTAAGFELTFIRSLIKDRKFTEGSLWPGSISIRAVYVVDDPPENITFY